jgi:hypothetical protein
MAKTLGPFTMPDPHATAIGRIAETWAQLEFQIDRGIWELVGVEHQLTACITAQLMSAHPRMKAFTALAEVRGASDTTLSKLNTFAAKIGGLSEKRNRTVHDSRTVDKTTNKVFKLEITAKPKVHFGFKEEQVEDLKRIHNQIQTALREFIALRDGTLGEIRVLPEASRPKLRSISPVRPRTPRTNDQPKPHKRPQSSQG